MPVKLGKSGTNGCSGSKPWPLLEVSTGKKVACGGPSREEAVAALQVRNMRHAGIPALKATSEGIRVA